MATPAARIEPRAATCRFCGTPLSRSFVDLGTTPLSNAYLRADDLGRGEMHYPLHAFICDSCLLVQIEAFETPERIFGDYAYFSSYSESWLAHCQAFAEKAVARFGLGADSLVVEVASNDGYLLQYFAAAGVPVLGIEPAANVAQVARARGIETRIEFFGSASARDLAAAERRADLLVANNVLAHVPDLNDFAAGLRIALKPDGVASFEFPHLLELIAHGQFDTIYHEHFSYFSFLTAQKVLAAHGLRVFDVERVPTHGGSLRVYACHAACDRPSWASIAALERAEREAGLDRLETYDAFAEAARRAKRALVGFLLAAKADGKRVAAYGAAAKGNTLLNYCGLRTDVVDYVVDRSPHKQGLFLPGTRIPVFPPVRLRETRPDYVLILPWNLKDEIVSENAYVRDWGGRFVVPIPQVEVLP